MQIEFSQAAAADVIGILHLLREVDLPPDGVEDIVDAFCLVRESDGDLLACAAVEPHASAGLLRSVAVSKAAQGRGIGKSLVAEMIRRSRGSGLKELVLLTTTARTFFEKEFGFTVSDRETHDAAFSRSPEWNLPRCSSAVVMKLDLR